MKARQSAGGLGRNEKAKAGGFVAPLLVDGEGLVVGLSRCLRLAQEVRAKLHRSHPIGACQGPGYWQSVQLHDGRTSMRAAIFEGVGRPLVVEDIPQPQPRQGEVLIKVAGCGV